MRITVHRELPTVVGVRDDGQWVERFTPGGEWVEVDTPAWAVETPTPDPHAMRDPYVRSSTSVEMVTVRRVIERRVPDYEAEVLVRLGWEIVAQ